MRLMEESYPNGKEIEMDDHIDWLRELGQIYEEAHDVIQYINLRHLEIERLQRENEELRKAALKALSNDEFARADRSDALKAQSTEPVAWQCEINGTHVVYFEAEPPADAYDDGTLVPLYTTPPTATDEIERLTKDVEQYHMAANELRQQLAEAKKDAERYRWLRMNTTGKAAIDVDEYIDQAMREGE